MQIYLIGIRDSPDHRSVRNPGGGGGGGGAPRGGWGVGGGGGGRGGGGGGETPHMKWVLMLCGNFELNP